MHDLRRNSAVVERPAALIKNSSSLAPSPGPGLSVNIASSGLLWVNASFANSSNLNIPLAPNSLTYVFMNSTTGAIQCNTTGYTDSCVPICSVSTTLSVVMAVIDNRPDYFVLPVGTPTPNFMDDETPSGTINGTNETFTLNKSPNPPASLMLFTDGIMEQQGEDYTLSGNTITFGVAPPNRSVLLAFYRY